MTKPFQWGASDWWDKQVNRQGYGSTQGQTLPGQILWKDLSPTEQNALSQWFEDKATNDPTAIYKLANTPIGNMMKVGANPLNLSQEDHPFNLPTDSRSDLYQGLAAAYPSFYAAPATSILSQLFPDMASQRGITSESVAQDIANKQTWGTAMDDAADKAFNMQSLGMLATVLGAGALGGAFSGTGAASGGANAMAGSMGLEGIGAAGGAVAPGAGAVGMDTVGMDNLMNHLQSQPWTAADIQDIAAASVPGAGTTVPEVFSVPNTTLPSPSGVGPIGNLDGVNPLLDPANALPRVGANAAGGLSGLFQSLGLPSELSSILSPLLQGLGGSYLARNQAGAQRDAARDSLAMLWPGQQFQHSTFWPEITRGTRTLSNMYFGG